MFWIWEELKFFMDKNLERYHKVYKGWKKFKFSYWLDQHVEKAMAPHSSTLVWKIPWMEEPGGLQSMGSLKVGHDWATSLSLFTFMHWRRKWRPTPVFLPGESQGQGSLVAAIYGVAQSRTRLKWLSSSSSYLSGSITLIVLNWCLDLTVINFN